MNKILKLLIALLVCWIIAFCVSFYTASDNLDMFLRENLARNLCIKYRTTRYMKD